MLQQAREIIETAEGGGGGSGKQGRGGEGEEEGGEEEEEEEEGGVLASLAGSLKDQSSVRSLDPDVPGGEGDLDSVESSVESVQSEGQFERRHALRNLQPEACARKQKAAMTGAFVDERICWRGRVMPKHLLAAKSAPVKDSIEAERAEEAEMKAAEAAAALALVKEEEQKRLKSGRLSRKEVKELKEAIKQRERDEAAEKRARAKEEKARQDKLKEGARVAKREGRMTPEQRQKKEEEEEKLLEKEAMSAVMKSRSTKVVVSAAVKDLKCLAQVYYLKVSLESIWKMSLHSRDIHPIPQNLACFFISWHIFLHLLNLTLSPFCSCLFSRTPLPMYIVYRLTTRSKKMPTNCPFSSKRWQRKASGQCNGFIA